MKIAIVGYGKMGQAIEKAAHERGHTVSVIIDTDNQHFFESQELKNADAAIEFTTPKAAFGNYQKLFALDLPVVSGTTGWLEHRKEVERLCSQEGKTFFYAPNFNLGVNIFFEVSRRLAELMNRIEGYSTTIEEVHHIHKQDAPSGTAIKLAEILTQNLTGKNGWSKGATDKQEKIPVFSQRTGAVPGTHTLTFDSEMDTLSIRHEAKSRKGFAMGAILAAEFVKDKTGFYTMQDMLKL